MNPSWIKFSLKEWKLSSIQRRPKFKEERISSLALKLRTGNKHCRSKGGAASGESSRLPPMSCRNLRCKNVPKFVKLSHSEGRRQHESHQRVSKLIYSHTTRSNDSWLIENIQNPVKGKEEVGRSKISKITWAACIPSPLSLNWGKESQSDFDKERTTVPWIPFLSTNCSVC